MSYKFQTVELTFQLKTAYEFSKNLMVLDAICFNVREISFAMTIKCNLSESSWVSQFEWIKLSIIWMYMLRFMHWTWDSPFLSRFCRIICEIPLRMVKKLKGIVHPKRYISTYSKKKHIFKKKVALPGIAKSKKSLIFVLFENEVSYDESFCPQVF